MQIEPSASAFAEHYARGEAQVVWTTLVADLETPVSAYLKIASGHPPAFLLELVEGGAVRGRYSIIGLEPDVIWRTIGARAEINRSPHNGRDRFTPCNEHHSRPCARWWPKAGSSFLPNFRRWPRACLAISATTWCG